jgi:hypothetical protein
MNAHQKEPAEDVLHDQVCHENVVLAHAERIIATDWSRGCRRAVSSAPSSLPGPIGSSNRGFPVQG